MIEYAIVIFLGIGAILGMLGFSGVLGIASGIMKILFVVSMILAVAAFIYSLRKQPEIRLRSLSSNRMSRGNVRYSRGSLTHVANKSSSNPLVQKIEE